MIEIFPNYESDEHEAWAGQLERAFSRNTSHLKLFAYTYGYNYGYKHVAIGPIDRDLSHLVSRSGIYRLIKRSFSVQGQMNVCTARVEIYPLGKPSIDVEFFEDATNRINNTSMLSGYGYRRDSFVAKSSSGILTGIDLPRVKNEESMGKLRSQIIDILSSRTCNNNVVRKWNEIYSGDELERFLNGTFDTFD